MMHFVWTPRALAYASALAVLSACTAAPAYAVEPILTVRQETPAHLVMRCGEAWEHAQTVIEGGSCPSVREIMCAGPEGALVADDDPGLALFEGGRESRKVALAIERTNSCDDEDRRAFKAKQARLYELLTDGEFVCDDHPDRCDDDAFPVSRAEYEAITLRICGPNGSVSRDETGPVCDRPEDEPGQPWFCEDYRADGAPPWPGCTYEEKPHGR